jgi:RNA polymerase sigma-70 factor (ECF subfamily)
MMGRQSVNLSRRTDVDPAEPAAAGEVQPGRRIGPDVPSHPAGAGKPGQHVEPTSAIEDPEWDRALMRRVCEHDVDALTVLYDRYAALVNGLALSILHNSSLAEEATHDVFLRVWQQPTAYDPARGSFAGWLLRVARNRSIDVLRRRREDPIGGLEADRLAWILDPAPGPEEQAMTQLRRQEVRRALDELVPDQRRLLELAYFTGLSQSQIAHHLGRPLGTVKSQIRSAMQRLAERLGSPDHLSGTSTTRTRPDSGERS